jgi:hypothetical protein
MRAEHFSLTLLTRYRTKFRGFLEEAYIKRVLSGYQTCALLRFWWEHRQTARYT